MSAAKAGYMKLPCRRSFASTFRTNSSASFDGFGSGGEANACATAGFTRGLMFFGHATA